MTKLKTVIVILFLSSLINNGAQVNNFVKKWWTEEDLKAMQTNNSESVLNKFNFVRTTPTQAPMFIAAYPWNSSKTEWEKKKDFFIVKSKS